MHPPLTGDRQPLLTYIHVNYLRRRHVNYRCPTCSDSDLSRMRAPTTQCSRKLRLYPGLFEMPEGMLDEELSTEPRYLVDFYNTERFRAGIGQTPAEATRPGGPWI